MTFPDLSHNLRLKIAIICYSALIQQLFRPLAQGTAKPFRNRQRKTLLGAINQLRGDILIEEPAKYPLASAIPKLHNQRQTGRQLHNAVIEIWHAPFQTYSHGCAVELDQDIVWKISHSIKEHHLDAEVTELWPCASRAEQ